MKNLSITIFSLFFLLFTTTAAAQMYGEGPGSPGLMQPHRVGFIHEGAVTAAFLTGEAGADYNGASGGFYYTGLFRPTVNFAYGIHIGSSYAEHNDYASALQSFMLGGEARLYLPVDLFDFWGSVFLGVGGFQEDWGDGYDEDPMVGAVTGFGIGGDYYITPNMSFGFFVRLYKVFYEDKDVPIDNYGDITYDDYYGLWGTVGFSASVHY
ncbi:MAG: hypothetical protein PF689_09910 [Deltaproteobacteria bacterium]|jgi:hypothetical protein|nr:hypothetical protein [Deltaproteobacteria bacterium]